jgi:hypothetical protein
MQQAPSNNTQMRTAAIVTIVVIIGLLLVGRFITGMMNNDSDNTSTTIDTTNNNDGGIQTFPDNRGSSTNNTNTNLNTSNLGPVIVAQGVDRDNCAVDATNTFDDNDPIYVVLEDSELPSGTRMFARLYEDNRAVEDTSELVAEEDYENVCVSFVFEPTNNAEVWDTGNYEVEFFINGNSYQSASFQIR